MKNEVTQIIIKVEGHPVYEVIVSALIDKQIYCCATWTERLW